MQPMTLTDAPLSPTSLSKELMFDSITDSILICDHTGRISYANNSACELFGYPLEKLITLNVSDLTATGEKPEPVTILSEVAQSGSWKGQSWMCHSSERKFMSDISISVVKPIENKSLSFLRIDRDVTDYLQNSQIMKLQEELLDLGLTTSKAMVFLHDRELNYIWVKNKHTELANFPFIGKQDKHIYPKSDVQKLTRLKTMAIEQNKAIHEDITLHINNQAHTFLLSLQPFYDTDDSVMGLLGAMNDITYYKLLENNLSTTLILYTSLVENQTDMISRFNTQLEFTFVNKQMEEFFGKSNEELIGVNWLSILNVDNKEAIKTRIKQWLKHPLPRHYENVLQDNRGHEHHIQWIDTPIYDEKKNVIEIQSVGRDITQMVRSQLQIQQQHDKLLFQAEQLTNLNTTLKVLLEQAEKSRIQFEHNIKQQISLTIKPIINKLSALSTSDIQRQYFHLLSSNLQQLTAKEHTKMDEALSLLTQREIEIALLIKDGKSSQEISAMLFLSENTIKTHRKNIRAKLKCNKNNLQTYLRMIMRD